MKERVLLRSLDTERSERVRERKERRLLVVEIARVAVVTRRPGTVSLLTNPLSSESLWPQRKSIFVPVALCYSWRILFVVLLKFL